MSIKVYEAYRLPKHQVKEFMAFASKYAIEQCVKLIKDISPNKKQEAYWVYRYQVKPDGNLWNEEFLRNINITAEWAVRFDGEWIYLIPFGILNLEIAHVIYKALPDIQDYSYWNNSDRDKRVRVREWEVRGELWDRLLDEPKMIYRAFNLAENIGVYEAEVLWQEGHK